MLLNIKKNRKSRKLSIIKELGNVYDSVFFKGKKLDLLYNVMQNSHVHHYAAYATDISNALPFRFQVAKSEYGDATIGNEVKRIDIDEAKEYRLADILAASSCFPIAFEPINIPRDFNNISIDDEYAQSNMQTLLMDGGIIDNQGIDYLLEASKHMEIINKRGIDLAIISDAAASIGDQYQNVKESHIGKFAFILNLSLKIKKCIFEKLLSLTIIGLQVRLFVIGIFFLGISYFVNEICREVFLGGFITSICFFLFICWLKRIIPREMKKNDQIAIPKNLIWKVDFNQYCRIVSKRYKSFSKVVSTVMMGHIRKKNIELLSMNSHWTNRFIIPCISALTSYGSWKEDKTARNMMIGASSLMGISDEASNFHSTLWFSKEDIKNEIPKKILACGQHTICYELNLWVKSHNGRQTNMSGFLHQLNKDIEHTLEDDWENFKKDPFMMTELYNLN